MESYVREVYSRLSPDDPELEYVGLASTGARGDADVVVVPRPRGRFRRERRGPRRVGARRALLARRAARRARRRPGALPRELRSVALARAGGAHGARPARVPPSRVRSGRVLPDPPRDDPARGARCARILTVSDASRDDIVRYLGIPVRPHRRDAARRARARSDAAGAARAPGRQLLAVGNRMPHKGFETLLEALARIDPSGRPPA